MSYINANIVLPEELIKEIQKYVNGINLYIPKVPEAKRENSSYKLEISKRNQEIYEMFLHDEKVSKLATKYFLSEKSIYRILGEMKKKSYEREKSMLSVFLVFFDYYLRMTNRNVHDKLK